MEPTLEWVITLAEWDRDSGAITNVRWKVVVSDGETTVEIPGASRFTPSPTSENFTALDDVDASTVIGWVKKTTPNYLNTENRALAKFEEAKKISSSSGRGIPWEGLEIPKVVPKVY